MYFLNDLNGHINLCLSGHICWERLTLHVRLDNGVLYNLVWSKEEDCFTYEDWLKVQLNFVTKDQSMMMLVAAEIAGGISWPGTRWHPLEALKISIQSLGDISGLCAHYLYNSWWTRPHFDHALHTLPEKTQSLLYKVNTDCHHLLAFCDEQVRCEFQGGESEGLDILVYPAKAGVRQFTGVVALFGIGDDPFELINGHVQLGRGSRPFFSRPREQRKLPEMFDYLGWCSWDACYLDVNEQAVMAKARELCEADVPVKWMLVDDGWSEEVDRRLLSWKEDRSKFPSGFKGLKYQLEQYQVNWLGVWHALTGQWEGIDAEADFPMTLDAIDNLRKLPPTESGEAFRFWSGWHNYLASQGVDFIKVDVQSNLASHYRYQRFPGEVSRIAHQALEASAALYFDGRLLNCMGMASDQLWNRPSSALSRNSDDFFPDKSGNLREHALQNAYNAVFHDAFFQGDWDMWWTVHEDAESHGLLRAISGGPVYTSDPVGKTDAEQLMRLVFNDGRVVRCDQQGKVAKEQLFDNPLHSGKLLKIVNQIGDVGVVALFNISEDHEDITEHVEVAPYCHDSDDYLVYWFSRYKCVRQVSLPEVSLSANKSGVMLYYPRQPLLCIGLEDKILPPCAIFDQILSWEEDCLKLQARLRQGGRLLIYSEHPVLSIHINGQIYNSTNTDDVYSVECFEWDGEIYLECSAKRQQ